MLRNIFITHSTRYIQPSLHNGRSHMAKKALRTVAGGGIRSTPQSPTSAALRWKINFRDVEGSAGMKSSTDSNNLSGHLTYSVHDKHHAQIFLTSSEGDKA